MSNIYVKYLRLLSLIAGFTGDSYQAGSLTAVSMNEDGSREQIRHALPAWENRKNNETLPSALGTGGQSVVIADFEKRSESGVRIYSDKVLYPVKELLSAFAKADSNDDGIVVQSEWRKLAMHDWTKIWGWGALVAVVAAVLFAIGGRDPSPASE